MESASSDNAQQHGRYVVAQEAQQPQQRPVEGAKTLDNGIRVLKVVAAHPDGLSMTEIARTVGVHRTVAYRLLLTLGQHSLVTQGDDGRFRVGVGVLELSASMRSDLQSAAQPHLRQLADRTGATAHLTVLDGADAVSVAIMEPQDSEMHVAYRIGRRHPATVGAAGMAILAGRPAQPAERPEITRGRNQGYVASEGEIQLGAWGLAAPVPHGTDNAIASIGVVALGTGEETETSRWVISAAQAISRTLAVHFG
jgi:DNA-binding IclR family transcriptional regulator